MKWAPGQRYLAEFVGTFGLLMCVAGAAVFTLNIPGVEPTARLLMIALSIGFGVAGLVWALGDISGAHLNPAITVGAWVAGRISAREVVPYILSQVAGAIVAVGVIAGVAHGSASLWSSATSSGVAFASQGYAGHGAPYTVALGSVFLLEVVMTFLFVTVVLFATRSEGSTRNLAAGAIGLTLGMVHLVSLSIDGTSVNPARSFGPALLSAFFPADRWAIGEDWLFWVAPLLGGILAALLERALRPQA